MGLNSWLQGIRLFGGIFFFLILVNHSAAGADESVDITILHTNDIHSHFRSEKTPLGLGGVGRIKTTVQRLKSEIPNTILVDGGDWAEGSIYYTQGLGAQSLRMMDLIGYDVTIAGNHDWLNGPDALLDAIESAKPRMAIVSANLQSDQYFRGDEFKKLIPPYVIREVAGVKIAFIGLATYEKIYDKYFLPVTISEPFDITYRLSSKLKAEGKADVVVLISHNSVLMNQALLKYAPDVDLVIGAHDHRKLTKPVVVKRWPWGSGSAWVVETGCYGANLGRVDLRVTPDKKVELLNYQLIQMDRTIPEDPEIVSWIDSLEQTIENQWGPIFHDHVADSVDEFNRSSVENHVGNVVTDAYRTATGADMAVDSYKFIYRNILPGPMRTVDMFNTLAPIYNPATGKSWTVKVVPLTGRQIKWVLDVIYGTDKLSSYGLLSFSGLSFTYNPWFHSKYSFSTFLKAVGGLFVGPTISGVDHLEVQGKTLDPNATYRVAAGQGFIEALSFFDSYVMNLFPLDQLFDSGQEEWRVLMEYLRKKSPYTEGDLLKGPRDRSLQSNLGLDSNWIKWVPVEQTPQGMKAEVYALVKNYGATASQPGTDTSGPQVQIVINQNGINEAVDPVYEVVGSAQGIPTLEPGESRWYHWTVTLPERDGLYPVTAEVINVNDEVNHDNNLMTRWFTPPERMPMDATPVLSEAWADGRESSVH